MISAHLFFVFTLRYCILAPSRLQAISCSADIPHESASLFVCLHLHLAMAPGQRKLRDSCDACHVAKVKCIKTETGECLRCISSSTNCSFSPSDRRGKPRGAKNKCNRVPPQGTAQIPRNSKPPARTQPQGCAAPDEAYPSPVYELDQYFGAVSANPHPAELMEGAWAMPSTEDMSHAMDLGQPDDAVASMFQNEWMNFTSAMLTADPQLLQGSHATQTPRTSISSPYQDHVLDSPCSFGPQQYQTQPHPHPHPQAQAPCQDVDLLEPLTASPQSAGGCKCYPITLQSLYNQHGQAISASSGSTTPFDVALFINNRAIERCHAMLTCPECVLSPDSNKSSTSMLMLAGTMEDILASYGTTCVAYLDNATLDSLVLSSGDSSTTSSSLSGSPRMNAMHGFNTRTQSMSSQGSSHSSSTSMSMHGNIPSLQFSLGTYRLDGEDGRHLKLEILKIELRKMERLWAVFRDICAHQRCQDDQKSLYAALVCYLAKKLRTTSELLESRRRAPGTAW